MMPPIPYPIPHDSTYTESEEQIVRAAFPGWEVLVDGKPASVGDTVRAGQTISYRYKQAPGVGATGSIGPTPAPAGWAGNAPRLMSTWNKGRPMNGGGAPPRMITHTYGQHSISFPDRTPPAARDGNGSLLCQSCKEPFPYAEPDEHGGFRCYGCRSNP